MENVTKIVNRVSDSIIASKERRAINRCFCCQQKQAKALKVAIRTARCEMNIIAIRSVLSCFWLTRPALGYELLWLQLTGVPEI